MDDKILITQAEAAQILGRSVSTVSRCLRDGKLQYADERRRLLLRQGLEDRFRAATRPRIDAPQRKAQMEVTHHDLVPDAVGLEGPPISTDYWQRLTDKLTCVMDGAPAYWSEAPDPRRLRLFCRALDELRSQVEAEGLSPQVKRGSFGANYLS